MYATEVDEPLLRDRGDVRGAVLTLTDTPREPERTGAERAADGRSA